jgi:methylated-DNA-[protein]-cysteine S-methyltransferase
MIDSVTSSQIYSILASPIGDLLLISDGIALVGLHMPLRGGKAAPGPKPHWRRDDASLRTIREQLGAYFAGELREFEVPIRMAGTPFQRLVWEGLRTIPYGVTISYAELARRVGHPGAARAIGAANGRNPIGIVVPCHRVIGADGTLTGYGGGLDRKQWLLEHESSVLRRPITAHPTQRSVASGLKRA